MSRGIRILVPSSDRKRSGGSDAFQFFEAQKERGGLNRFPSLVGPKTEVMSAFLAAINGQGHAAEVLRLEGERLEEVRSLNLAARTGPLLAVHERDIGPLFTALDAASLPVKARGALRNRVLVVCPLLGLLSPMDWVPIYRCPVGTKIPGFGSLHAFWKPRITTILNRICRSQQVVSFLPRRLEALWDPSCRSAPLLQIRFARRKADASIIAEHAGSRRVAGEMINWMLREDIDDPEALKSFRSSAGNVYDPRLDGEDSGVRSWVFVR